MDKQLKAHFDDLKAAAFNTYDLRDAGRYITDHTFIEGKKFSFQDYPFQEALMGNTSRNICVMKPAQVGMSEIVARYTLALCRIIPNFTAIYISPYSGDSTTFMKTRIDPIIANSPDLKSRLDAELNNMEIKGFGSSLLFARGASGTTQALSIPADLLVFDELDKADPDTVGQYMSRLRASKYKLTRKLSTPTLKGRGIELATRTTRRWHYVCKCNRCTNVFIPDYEEHVVIPGFEGEKKEITKDLLPTIRWKEAKLLCPKCGKEPDLHTENRFWLMENPSENYEDDYSYIISPFDAPKIHTPASITKEITGYNSYGEAQNQVLGKVASDQNDQLTEQDWESLRLHSPLNSSNLHCMGADMGLTCTITIGRLTLEGQLLVVHREKVLMTDFEVRKRELATQYRVLTSVCDIYPYTDMIYRMQKTDKNLFGGLYHDAINEPVFSIRQVDGDAKEGKLPVNQARIKRDLGFDEILYMVKKRLIVWAAQDDQKDKEFIKHCTDMKRVQKFNRKNEMVYNWEKSEAGNDHFHHSLLYLLTACRLMPTASRNVPLSIPIISKFKVK